MRESEEKYAALLAASPVPFMVLEPNPPDFTITAANEAYFAATLTTPEGLIGRRLFDVFTDDPNRPGDHGSEALALSLDRVLTSRRPDAMARTRCDIVTPDGGFEPHWWLAINAPLLNASGEVTAIIHQVTRVTELHLAQEAERKNQERQVFLLQMSDAMRSLADPLEIQETVTRTAMNHFGADRCYYCEIEDGNAIIWRDATREGLPTVAGVYPLSSFAILQAAINSGHPFVVQDVYTTDRVDEDIRQLCIQLQVISFIDVPVIKDGKPVGILCLVQSTPRDWTDLEVELTVETAERTWAAVERAHAEAALRGSEAKYRTLFESINDGFCTIEVIFDQNEKPIDYRFLEISPSFERQTGLADALGKRVRELAPNHEEYWFEIYGNVALSGQSVRFENYARELQRWFEVYAFSVGELEDRQVAVVLSVINDRKQAQANQIQLIREQAAREQERQRAETLAELDRAKTLFFSNVSHEFRTPLTLSLAPLQDALSDSANPLPPAQQERLQLAHSNSLRLLKLVNTLLDFSRIEANRLNANYEPTDLSTYTAELASVFRSAIENANLELVVDCPPLPDPIYVDREMWEKIVLNLLSNALKFTFEGIISVSLQPKANTVELIVSDTGVGISASELPYLFERFYQVKGAKGRSYEGSGIGLFLVQELVKRHGGAIAVTSAVDQGTIFTVTIPTGIAHLPADQIWVASTLASSAVTANAFVEEALHWLPEESTEFQNSEVQAQNSEVHAQNSQVQAQSSEVHAQNSEVHAQNSQVHAQNSEVQAQNSQVHAQNSEVHAQNSQVQAQNSQVQAQNSEVHAQNSEVHAQNSEVQVQNSEVHAPSSKRARILLVDDNADMRGYLKRLLNQYYEVETVNDGLAALTAILRGGSAIYDLVLADVMMPRMDGFELLRSLRASPNTQTIPIILLSARAGEESRVEGLETGADDYLIKPFSARELLARVNANLQLAQLRREAVYREQVMQAVQTLNERLEQQVKARTAQLEAINQELEAFSSSISHDLQIPLRYISSFAEQLQAKLNATLVDASSLQILNIITQSTLQAEKMVDDLLEFSRLGQTKMYLTTVNITQLVQQVREQLQLELVGRSLHWEIEPLLTAKGDSALLRLVLQNLLSNAVKYTHNNSEAAIKIGRIEQEQEVIFFVKDNGAGFDMKYCDQLFSIFQRLHSQEEFPGTGVGLATVRRIIHRHGGRIWAEGAIDQGATFYFSLPKREAQL
ncbi:MAG: ATP-binding protein [Nostoc sp.]|uniref:ATP-binding protein n=1 Tax=Nostoc sp. TaxID=1180 RepID=UPI002FF5E718